MKKIAKELHKTIISKFNLKKVHSPSIDNIWSAYFAEMQLISKFDKGFRFFLCFIDIYSKYAWVMALKDNKEITIIMLFKKF